MCLISKQEKCFIITEDIYFLDPAIYLFSRLKEEAARSCYQNFLSKLILALFILWIEYIAELVFFKDSHRYLFNESLIDIYEMSRSVLICYKPFFSSLALSIISIDEGLLSLEKKS